MKPLSRGLCALVFINKSALINPPERGGGAGGLQLRALAGARRARREHIKTAESPGCLQGCSARAKGWILGTEMWGLMLPNISLWVHTDQTPKALSKSSPVPRSCPMCGQGRKLAAQKAPKFARAFPCKGPGPNPQAGRASPADSGVLRRSGQGVPASLQPQLQLCAGSRAAAHTPAKITAPDPDLPGSAHGAESPQLLAALLGGLCPMAHGDLAPYPACPQLPPPPSQALSARLQAGTRRNGTWPSWDIPGAAQNVLVCCSRCQQDGEGDTGTGQCWGRQRGQGLIQHQGEPTGAHTPLVALLPGAKPSHLQRW